MNKIGIFDINNNTPSLSFKNRLDFYKKIGFSHLGIYLDNKYMRNNENYKDIIDYAKKIDLKIRHVHLDYKNSNHIYFKTFMGLKYYLYLKFKIKEALKLNIKYIIIHPTKTNTPPKFNNIASKRIKKLNKLFKNTNSYLCFENVRESENLKAILNLNLSNVRMCFDSGHYNCYCKNDELLKKYNSKIITTHLHNNFGKDDHQLMSDGNIDWDSIFSNLKNTERKIDYLEVFPPIGKKLNKNEFELFLKNAKEEYFFYIRK